MLQTGLLSFIVIIISNELFLLCMHYHRGNDLFITIPTLLQYQGCWSITASLHTCVSQLRRVCV